MARRIRERRTQLRLTQDEIGEKVGVKAQAVWRWEAAEWKTMPRGANLTELAKALQTTERWIMEGEEESRVESAFAYEEELRSWLKTPEGLTATKDEIAELRAYRGKRRPDDLMWHYLLMAARSGASPAAAQAEAEETEAALSEAIARGGRPLKRKK